MRLITTTCLVSILFASFVYVGSVQGVSQSPTLPWYKNRVVVGFWNNTDANARHISSNYDLPVLSENSDGHFAVFRPDSSSVSAFLSAVKNDPVVKYAEISSLSCNLSGGCGGGGGGGGGGSGSSPTDFTVSANPSHLAVLPGVRGITSTITVTSINSFFGTINLAISSSSMPIPPGIDPTSVYLNYTGPSTTKTAALYLSIDQNTPLGTYSTTVTATFAPSGMSHSTTVIVDVTSDFSISASSTSVTVMDGQTGTSAITVTSTGYSGTINLGATVSPNGPSLALNPAQLNLPSGGSAASTLSIVTGNLPLGNYAITVTGNNVAASHYTTVGASIVANDPESSNQWALNDLNLPQAWVTTLGTGNRVIAVLDTGAMLGHPDLQSNLWTNPSDGSHGWDCIHNDNNPVDDHGHGTMVAGIIAATTNNGVGIAGAAQDRIMIVKVTDLNENGTADTVACGIDWATDHGANIINMSFGGGDTTTLSNAVDYAWNHGVLMIASSGNDMPRQNIVVCPACYNHVIAVTALQQGDGLAGFSDYGSKVELAAPGDNIESTSWPNNRLSNGATKCPGLLYCSASGTSFAAPYVSGIAALAWDYDVAHTTPGLSVLTNQQIRDSLDAYTTPLSTVTCPSDNNQCFGHGKPDAAALLNGMKSQHAYILTAQWQFFSSSGTEGKSQVYVDDYSNNNVLLAWPLVGNGQTVSISPGIIVQTQFVHCFYDGTHNVSLDHVTGTGGTPSGSVPATQPFQFTMGAVPASVTAVYYVVTGC